MIKLLLWTIGFVDVVRSNNVDQFNYGYSDESISGGTSYGQPNWGRVTCDNLNVCAGYPDKFEHGRGFTVAGSSKCRWCPETGPRSCGLHRQSPIDLHRDRGIIGNPNEKECPDWHWMQYRDGSCSWSDYSSQFKIERQALKINVPIRSDGEIDCLDSYGERRFPRLDYSKGFPDWFYLDHTSITVPSQHTQEGKRYDAEVTLAHFYQIEHHKNQLGHIVLFMDAYDDAERWPFLDKLICQWRKEEEVVRSNCGLEPAPPYGRCSLWRNQAASEDWLREAGLWAEAPPVPPPTEVPIQAVPETSMPVDDPGFTETGGEVGPPAPTPLTVPTIVGNEAPHRPRLPTGSPPVVESVVPPPVMAPTPVVSPVPPPVQPPTPPPVSMPVQPPTGTVGAPPPIDCGAYPLANYARMCASSSPCCESVRSATDYCWDYYENIFPGELMKSACYYCCPNGPLEVGDPNPPKDGLVQTIRCSDVDNPFRICKDNSCCSNPRSSSSFCRSTYSLYPDTMDQICHYCCSEPKEVGPTLRYLRSTGNTTSFEETIDKEVMDIDGDSLDEIPEGAKIVYVNGRKTVLRKENFYDDDEDEFEYFDRIYKDFKHRHLQTTIHSIDYDDVPYWPYEWMLKVGTEYYFRYEGSQVTPPCWDVVHWRVLKDPITIPPSQLKELQRLLAWRRNPDTCQLDTAGQLSVDGNSVNLAREIQYYHTQHRKVFCECKNWPSKFEGDKQWCRDWRNDPGEKRFYGTPYSFDTGGAW